MLKLGKQESQILTKISTHFCVQSYPPFHFQIVTIFNFLIGIKSVFRKQFWWNVMCIQHTSRSQPISLMNLIDIFFQNVDYLKNLNSTKICKYERLWLKLFSCKARNKVISNLLIILICHLVSMRQFKISNSNK